MKAWRIFEPKKLEQVEIPHAPATGKNVKIKLSYSALSTSDRLVYTGQMTPKVYPLTIGRQGVGMVTEVGEEVTSFARGDRVVVDPYVFCEECGPCKDGRFNECMNPETYGVHEDGLLSDFAIVRYEDVFKLPERVKDTDAIFTGHVAFALNILSKLNLEKGEHLVIVGASVVGILLAQAAIYYQAVPILVDSRAERLKIAERLGVYYCINSVDEDVPKKIFSLTGGNMSETVCYLSYSDAPLSKSLELAKINGRVVIAGWSGMKH